MQAHCGGVEEVRGQGSSQDEERHVTWTDAAAQGPEAVRDDAAGDPQLCFPDGSLGLSALVVGQKQISDDIAAISGEQRAVARTIRQVQKDIAELLAAVRGGGLAVPSCERAEPDGTTSPPSPPSLPSEGAASPEAWRSEATESGAAPGGCRGSRAHPPELLTRAQARRSHSSSTAGGSMDVQDLRPAGKGGGQVPPDDDWPANIALREALHDLQCVVRASSGSQISSERTRRGSTCSRFSSHCLSDSSSAARERTLRLPRALLPFMVHPTSKKRRAADAASMVVLAIDLAVIPYMLAWDLPFEGFFQVAAWGSCIFWTLHMVMKLLTGVEVDGQLQPRTAISPVFALDLGVLLCDWVSFQVATARMARFAKAGRLMRIVKLLRVMSFFSATEDYISSQLSEKYKMLLNISVLSFAALLVNHWISCSWIMMGRGGPTDTGFRWVDAEWVIDGQQFEFVHADRLYQYVVALHWSVAQLTGGSMDVICTNSMERLFNIVCLIMGLTCGSTVVSSLSAMMINLQMMRKDRTLKMQKLRHFLQQNAVDWHMRLRVQQQAQERLGRKEDLSEQDVPVLGLLSTQLRTELRVNIFQRHLLTHPLFRLWSDLDDPSVKRLCDEAITFLFFRKKDDLFVTGTKADSAYYLASGTVRYIQDPDGGSPDDMPTTEVVPECTWMCEAALWTDWVHVGRAEAATHAKVLAVSSRVLLEAVRQHRRVRDVTLCYATRFHRLVVTASPPASELPTDLAVPFTGWDDMVLALDKESQVQVSLVALEELRSQVQAGFSSLLRAAPQRLEKLRSEVLAGKSCLLVNAEGEVQRVVSVVVLRIERASADGTHVLVQLGKLKDGEMHPSCQLPGGKQESGELANETLQRLLSVRFANFSGCVEVQRTDREVHREYSKAYSVNTKYLRTVCTCSLVNGIEARKLLAGPPPFRDANPGKSVKAVPSMRRSSSTQSLGSTGTVLGEREVLVVGGQDTGQLFLAWLLQEEFERLALSANADVLSAWLLSLEQQLHEAPTEYGEVPAARPAARVLSSMRL